MDGGSRDGSVEIIKKYESKIHYWQSGPDGGQAAAIEAGIKKSTGSILAYLNSDDYLLPGALSSVADFFLRHPEVQWICSDVRQIFEGGKYAPGIIKADPQTSFEKYFCKMPFAQPGVFWRAQTAEKAAFEKKYQYCMDFDFFAKLFYFYGPPAFIPSVLAVFRTHDESKSSTMMRVCEKESTGIVRDWTRKLPWHRAMRLQYYWQTMLLRGRLQSAKSGVIQSLKSLCRGLGGR